MFSTILIIIILIGVAVLVVMSIKKLPKVLAVDVKSNVLKQASVKQRLLEERFRRSFSEQGKKITSLISPLIKSLNRQFSKFYQKLVDLEQQYRHKVLKTTFSETVAKEQTLEKLLNRAAVSLEAEDYDKAEEQYIEILTIDQKNTLAYKGLGEVYLLKKDYEHAKETFEFLLKISQNDPFIYKGLGQIAAEKGDLKVAEEDYLKSLEIDQNDIETYLTLADIYLNLDNPQKAHEMAEKAAMLEPNNPRVLDFLIEVSIIVHDKPSAIKAYYQLKEANPDNQKFAELKEKIDNM